MIRILSNAFVRMGACGLLLGLSVAAAWSEPSLSDMPEELTLVDAVRMAEEQNPALRSAAARVLAHEGQSRQARLVPNPELEVAIEEYDRDGAGYDSAETVVVLGQQIELGGKRRGRGLVADAEADLAALDYEESRMEVVTGTAQRFMAVIAAQRRLALAESGVALAEKTSHAVSERVKAGKEPPLQSAKVEAELEMARMAALEAEANLDTSRSRLAAMWGATSLEVDAVQGELDRIPVVSPSLEEWQDRFLSSPALARAEAQVRLRMALLSSEEAARIPDVEAAVGFKHFEEDGTDAMIFGVGMPLPLFDRNQGNISSAEQELVVAQSERAAVEADWSVELAEIYAGLTLAHRRVETLRSKVVPAMEQAFEAAHEGYRQGKFGFLDMLDSQRGLFESKEALVDALSDYHDALARIQRLAGVPFEELMNRSQEDKR